MSDRVVVKSASKSEVEGDLHKGPHNRNKKEVKQIENTLKVGGFMQPPQIFDVDVSW